MHFDHLAEKAQQTNFTVWFQILLQKQPELACQLAFKHRPGNNLTAVLYRTGGYNVTFLVKYEDGYQAIVRFASLGQSLYRTEKVENEAIALQYLRKHTEIPVPRLLGVGKIALGPYIVEEFISGDLASSSFMESRIERQNLKANVNEHKLKHLYREMANVLLEMAKPEFTRIGSLSQTENGYTIGRRPLTKHMNELAMRSNLAPQHFPTSMHTTSAGYFETLLQQHMAQLRNQKNNCVKSERDYKEKYMARCLLLRIARHIALKHSTGPFRLFCEDFRPSNIIATTENHPLQIKAVIDLEFTYSAPSAFTNAAPWWLLLQNPEEWELDLKGSFLPRATYPDSDFSSPHYGKPKMRESQARNS